jgi:hypothetical protein
VPVSNASPTPEGTKTILHNLKQSETALKWAIRASAFTKGAYETFAMMRIRQAGLKWLAVLR